MMLMNGRKPEIDGRNDGRKGSEKNPEMNEKK